MRLPPIGAAAAWRAISSFAHASNKSHSCPQTLALRVMSLGRLGIPQTRLGLNQSTSGAWRTMSSGLSNILLPPKRVVKPIIPRFFGGVEPEYECMIPKSSRLPALTQFSTFGSDSISLLDWMDPVDFLRENDAVTVHGNPLIKDPEHLCGRDLILACWGQRLLKNLLDLVCENRMRGLCIQKGLSDENIVISPLLGTVRMKAALAENIMGRERIAFTGYQRVRSLFTSWMIRAFGSGIMDRVIYDVIRLMELLDAQPVSCDWLATNHSSLLSCTGRALMCIRTVSALRSEIRNHYIRGESTADQILTAIGYMGNFSGLHPFFEIWQGHSKQLGQMHNSQSQQRIDEIRDALEGEALELFDSMEAGKQLSSMHRNGVLHHHGPELSAVYPGLTYRVSHVIELLHLLIPNFLPDVQNEFYQNGMWNFLEMASCFSEEVWPYYSVAPFDSPGVPSHYPGMVRSKIRKT